MSAPADRLAVEHPRMVKQSVAQDQGRFGQATGFALICFVTLIAYLPALRGGMVWDDDAHLTKPVLQSLKGLWRIWFELGATQQYYPLLHSAFWVEHRLWGNNVLGYHLVNLILHAAAACLVVLIVQQLRLPGAWLAGIIFALHPVCVESVAWISEQKSTLSAVFYLGSALLYLRFDNKEGEGGRSLSRYLLASGMFLLALLTKTVTAMLPAGLLIVIWWRRGGINWRRDILPLLPWLIVGAATGLFTAWVEKTIILAQGSDFALSGLQRVLLAGRVLGFYAAKLFWPANLIFIYPRWNVDAHVWWQYLFTGGAIAAGIALLFLARRSRGPLAAYLFFWVTLFPVLGFFNVYPFRFSFVADHFQYLASLGVIIPTAALLAEWARKMSLGHFEKIGCAAALVVVLGTLSWNHAQIFRNAEMLYESVLARNPGCWLAEGNLGSLLLNRPNRKTEAVAHLKEALRLRPDFAEAENNLGLSFLGQPELRPQAQAAFESAVRMNPRYAPAHNNLGTIFLDMPDRLPDAIREYQTAVRIRPDYSEARCNLALALARTPGRAREAVDEIEEALRIDPSYPRARRLASQLGAFQ